ncbi:MAG TPA: hypothetical protein VEA80_15170 [Vitreimonas sp.]|uniref:hypothetical protein n=1 Tax=Vitreimonas sp. TaxID=3069702 RepID=UPI002D7293D0|nr:hypothetical protein [Vitreimonas sp.]HYD88814.1 hypothetical protein [Vitreimonas sp.]
MTLLRSYRPEVRLQQMLARPGGLSIEQALANAQQGVETLRSQCTAAVDATIAKICALTTEGAEKNAKTIYALADEVFALAGTFDMTDVSKAAYSLCALLASEEGAKKGAAIRVHVEALKALRNPLVAADANARTKVLEGLVNVSKRYGKFEDKPLAR